MSSSPASSSSSYQTAASHLSAKAGSQTSSPDPATIAACEWLNYDANVRASVAFFSDHPYEDLPKKQASTPPFGPAAPFDASPGESFMLSENPHDA
jgi:hypothetical protein